MRYAASLLVQAILLLLAGLVGAAEQPNVILVVTDDQGYGDIRAHGNPVIRTPHLDALYGESVRLTDFHVDPTCAPTRSALMTGKYAHRVRVWHTIQGGNHMRASEVTMADVFQHSDYNTAMFGKWHLGANYPYRPMDRGFDEWLGLGDGGTGTTDDFFWNDRVNDTYWHNGRREYREGYNPDVFYRAAIDYVKDYAKNYGDDRPFFLYLPTYVPHGPHTIPDKTWVQHYTNQGRSNSEAYFFASIERVDQNIGQLRAMLRRQGVSDNTIFIFLTDNGGTAGCRLFNAGMRGRKGSPYDGGHRVPCFIHWPAGGLNQPRDVSELTAHFDLFPTLIELCGLRLPVQIDFDGRSLVPLLQGIDTDWPARTLSVEVQRVVTPVKREASATMTSRWRLVNGIELYDMLNDPGQKIDVSNAHPRVVTQLRQAFDEYWERVTPGDRESARPIVGTEHQTEIFLGASELLGPPVVWNHAHVAAGRPAAGSWKLAVAQGGRYEVEVRRWPKEVNASMAGIPTVAKQVDAWTSAGPVEALLYGNRFVPLPVESVRLQVADHSETKVVGDLAACAKFTVNLPAGNTELTATMLNEDQKEIGAAYYVYIRPVPQHTQY
jgi:arylsulfatase A-like enzyme